MIASAHGARVIAVDVSPAALELAADFGAEEVVDARDADVVARVREITGEGARLSLDALGSIVTCQNSIRCLRKRGRHVQIGLMVADDGRPPVPMADVIAGELELVGSHGMAAHAYPDMLAEIVEGRLRPRTADHAQAVARRGWSPPSPPWETSPAMGLRWSIP